MKKSVSRTMVKAIRKTIINPLPQYEAGTDLSPTTRRLITSAEDEMKVRALMAKTRDLTEERIEIEKAGGTCNEAFKKKVYERAMNPNGKPLEWVMLKAFKDEASTIAILVYTARREKGKHDYFSLKIGAVGTHAEEAGILYAKAFVPIRYDYASLEHNAVGNPRLLFDVSGTIQKLVALAIDFITEQQIELRKTRRLEVVTKESQELLKGTKKKGKTEPPKRVPLPEEYKHLPVKKYKM